MGTVYAGIDDEGRRAAVKVIRSDLANDPEFRTRFAREITLLDRLQGAYTARMFGADAEAAQPWLATEYIAGPTLAQRVTTGGPLNPEEVIGLAAGLAEALRSLHAAGVVHRDLKPANVILSPTGPRLIDMGIARAMHDTSVTRTGMMVGSPGWISPEEYRGEEVGPAGDVHGWGLLVLYAATGRLAFGTGRPEVIAMRVATQTPDLDGVPAGLVPLVGRALAKDPAERPTARRLLSSVTRLWSESGTESADAAEVTRYLDRTWVMPLPDEPEWTVPKSATPWTVRKRLILAGAFVAAGSVLGAVILANAEKEQPILATPATAETPTFASTVPAASPSPTVDQSSTVPTADRGSATPRPTLSPTRTAAPGKRVTMIKGYSFVLPSDWMHFPDNTHNPDNMCLRPKSREHADYFYCEQYGMGIFPWWSPDGTFSNDLSWMNDADEVTGANSDAQGGCGYGYLLRKGKILKSGFHRVGNRNAHYRKARSYCKDGRIIESEVLVLPQTRLTITIDKIPASHRAQVEQILQSFRFPD